MKRFLTLLLVVFQIMLLVSCGGGKKNSETSDTTPDGDTDTSDTADSSSDSDTDPGDTATDSDAPENPDSEPDLPEKNAEGCTIFKVDESTFGSVYKNTYYGDIKDNILGDRTERDVFGIDILQGDGLSHAGTYDLGSGNNKSYLECTECVRVWQDHDNKSKVKRQ